MNVDKNGFVMCTRKEESRLSGCVYRLLSKINPRNIPVVFLPDADRDLLTFLHEIIDRKSTGQDISIETYGRLRKVFRAWDAVHDDIGEQILFDDLEMDGNTLFRRRSWQEARAIIKSIWVQTRAMYAHEE
jgi:hypothetical protein